MTNFFFLKSKKEYALFAPACVEAEKFMLPLLPCVLSAAGKRWNWQ